MNLTPVHIRGKRKNRSTTTSNPPSALAPYSKTSHPKSKQMKRSLSTVLSERSTRNRVSLDSLPAEILETILLYSCNLSLPRAEPHVGAKLSGRATLLRLFIWAFHDTWNQWFGIPARDDVYFGPEIKHREQKVCDGDPIFQSAILELPWVDIDFILQAQQTWADTYAKGRWYQHSIQWDVDESGQIVHHRDGHHEFNGGFHHFDSRQCFEADYRRALSWQPFETRLEPWGFRDVHPLTRVPAKLITGPWNEEQQRRVFWLTRGGALNLGGEGRAPAPPWEIGVKLLQNAITEAPEPNALVCNCLLNSWLYLGLPIEVVREELSKLKKRIEWGGDSVAARSILREVATTLGSVLVYTSYQM